MDGIVNNTQTNVSVNKTYTDVIKKTKKENITVENIDEILLSQLPGISSTIAKSIVLKFSSIVNLFREYEKNNSILENITYSTSKKQIRRIPNNAINSIKEYLLKSS